MKGKKKYNNNIKWASLTYSSKALEILSSIISPNTYPTITTRPDISSTILSLFVKTSNCIPISIAAKSHNLAFPNSMNVLIFWYTLW